MSKVFDLDEQRAIRAPLADPEQIARQALSACNGNCNQGRMCDCCPAVDEIEPPQRFDWIETLAWAIVGVAASVCAWVIVHRGGA